ncbi:class I glutamine amidotransferase-like protein [Apodospora peruviana]|uniref:Class I glutamine amidotransferase-like protein n=1 Tax=Apodospora peruviana TaxID=516989 RepID=A0AAE0IQ10_9PEZI|nr:class I glutamine amidotransferase-like protein [Apodospora peruviana]
MDESDRHKIHIGVFIPADSQLLDLACVDIFGTASYEYMILLKDQLPAAMYNLAPSVTISYIGTVPAGDLIECTSSLKIRCTHNLSSPEVAPGTLDIVLVPGPDPNSVIDDASKKWLAAHAARKETDILCVCTGVYVCGAAGILNGKKVSGPRGLQDDLKKKFEGVTWVGDELRWTSDGNFWSSGGVTNGNDLVAAYMRQSRHFPGPVGEMAMTLTDTGDRPQKYGSGQAVFTLGIVWQILKAVVMGVPGKTKKA